ncbi:MAG: hypothetical protein GC129_06515 [Proteobacteria bacterium]|nr:hypothetical protein [Pseudomonadota bacterium]
MSIALIAIALFTLVFLRAFFMPVATGAVVGGASIFLAPLVGFPPSPSVAFVALALGVAIGSLTLISPHKAKEDK